jgi:hypothetical protein
VVSRRLSRKVTGGGELAGGIPSARPDEVPIAERYVTSKAHDAAEERLAGAVESMRDEFRELVRRIDWYFGWAQDRPPDRAIERKGAA